jgi:hypothetical protein
MNAVTWPRRSEPNARPRVDEFGGFPSRSIATITPTQTGHRSSRSPILRAEFRARKDRTTSTDDKDSRPFGPASPGPRTPEEVATANSVQARRRMAERRLSRLPPHAPHILCGRSGCHRGLASRGGPSADTAAQAPGRSADRVTIGNAAVGRARRRVPGDWRARARARGGGWCVHARRRRSRRPAATLGGSARRASTGIQHVRCRRRPMRLLA